MSVRRFLAVAIGISAFVACTRTQVAPRPVVVTMAPPPSASVSANLPPEDPAPNAAAPESSDTDPTPRHKLVLTVRPGDPPCTLVLDANAFREEPEWFMLMGVSRMATESGGSCAASVFYDFATEPKQPMMEESEALPLEAGVFCKPGQTLPKDMDGVTVWNRAEDLDFDDDTDLCVVTRTEGYLYDQMCWLFDASSRTFVRNDDLDALIFMTIDRKKKTLSNSIRSGGSVHHNNEYEWQHGELVNTKSSMTIMGQTMDGKPLPPGFSHWEVRHERRKGALVKTFEGPIRVVP